jgi:hypothetical protein
MRASPKALQKLTQGVGKPLRLSGKKVPDPSTIRKPKAPACGFSSINRMASSMPSSGKTVSGFNSSTYFPSLARIPWLLAVEKPTFSLFAITLQEGNLLETISSEPSEE